MSILLTQGPHLTSPTKGSSLVGFDVEDEAVELTESETKDVVSETPLTVDIPNEVDLEISLCASVASVMLVLWPVSPFPTPPPADASLHVRNSRLIP